MVLGWAITILVIKGGVFVWAHKYRPGILLLIIGVTVAFVFFRKRIHSLVIMGLSFVLVNAGFTAVFHPTRAGILIAVGSFTALYLLVRWHARRFPNLNRNDWKRIFD